MRRIPEYTYYESPDGQLYYFTDLDQFMISETGLGMPPITYLTQRGPFQHGNTLYDYRLEPRIIQVVLRVQACDREAYWDRRATLLNILRPNRNAYGYFNYGKLHKVLGHGVKRTVDVMLEEGPAFQPRNTGSWDEWAFVETLRFIAPDPSLYDPTVKTDTQTVASVDDNIVFPITFPIYFSTSHYSLTSTITYNGTWQSFPTMLLVGPFAGALITNTSTGEFIEIDYVCADGESVTIDLPYGNKSVTSSIYGDIIGTVRDCDFATFHLAPAPEVTSGTNTITITGAGAVVASTSFTINYYERYIGM